MKKILISGLIIFLSCNSSDDLDTVKKDISDKVPVFLVNETKNRLLVNECKLYYIEKITEKDALNFRLKALSDSMIILNNLTEIYKRAIEAKQKSLREFDSLKQSTVEIQKLITRYNYLVDSTKLAAVVKKKRLDSLSLIKSAGSSDKTFYNTSFRVCSFNITTSSSCDSVAFLIDKKLNIISMHIIH